MTDRENEFKGLDDAFQASLDAAPQPDAGLMARVLADAEAVQRGFTAPAPRPVQAGIWQDLMAVLGGWRAMAGLATAAVAGVWLGVSPPGILPDATGVYLGASDAGYLIDTAPGLGFDLVEEAL